MVQGFKYHGTKKVFYAHYKDGNWQKGELSDSINFEISALASALQYGQSIFEGLKAYRSKDNRILLFRPQSNYERLLTSSDRLLIPRISKEMFLNAVYDVVRANKDLVPPYESKGSLYIRPFIIGTETVMGVRSAEEFMFAVVVTPVGSYFKDGFGPIRLTTTEYDRAAPNGLGNIKAGANYAASLYPRALAKSQGFDDCIYLDPKTHTKLDETGATNVIAVTYDNKFITPQSNSVLPSITNNSLQKLAKDYLKMEVIKRDILITELNDFKEFGACGTAAVITPISEVHHKGVTYKLQSYEILHKLFNLLQSIQYGDINEPYGWVIEV